MTNQLIVLEKVELVPFFTEGVSVDSLIEQIIKEARSNVPDVTTAKGRDAIKATVTKVVTSKTYLEKNGKTLAAKYKEIPKVIDANRRKVNQALEALQAEIRQPLTDYELEQVRIGNEKVAAEKAVKLASEVEDAHEFGMLLNDQFDATARVKAEAAWAEAVAAEAAQVAEALERDQRIKDEAAAAAEARAVQAIADTKASEDRAKQAAEQAKAREVQYVIDQAKAEAKAKADAIQAAEQAKAQEVARYEAEQQAEAEALAKRESNKKHIGKIRGEAKDALMSEFGFTEDQAKNIVLAIHAGSIPNIKIIY
jgi:colicin import membrane protein